MKFMLVKWTFDDKIKLKIVLFENSYTYNIQETLLATSL